MTPREADKVIKRGQPVTVKHAESGETFTILIIKRDRWSVATDNGGLYSRDDLIVIK
jgi:transcription elongation GreA/GreB family factor